VERSFLQAYLAAFNSISGWFQFDAGLMFIAYNQFLAGRGIAGDTLEIGVHHGLSAILVAALRGPDRRFAAVDLFEELQERNLSGSGHGDRAVFERNMRRFHPNLDFMTVIARPSTELRPTDLGRAFSFCHIDGGHSRRETLSDLTLAHSVLMPGGLVALDDYFNAEFPGVSEGAAEFMLGHPGALRPIAIGFSKVLFQKLPAQFDLNADFERAFPGVEHKTVCFWDTPARLFSGVLRSHFDLYVSTPRRLAPFGAAGPRARIEPRLAEKWAARGQAFTLPVMVTNVSAEAFPSGDRVFGLSYHLLSASGALLRHDNERVYLETPIEPGESRLVELAARAPEEPGRYRLEIDLVWEGLMWFKDIGNPTSVVELVAA
jgi:hypothetical protein